MLLTTTFSSTVKIKDKNNINLQEVALLEGPSLCCVQLLHSVENLTNLSKSSQRYKIEATVGDLHQINKIIHINMQMYMFVMDQMSEKL